MAVKMLMANFKGTDNVIGTYFRTFHDYSKLTKGFLVRVGPIKISGHMSLGNDVSVPRLYHT